MRNYEILRRVNQIAEEMLEARGLTPPEGEPSEERVRTMMAALGPALAEAGILAPPPFRSPHQPPVASEPPMTETQQEFVQSLLDRALEGLRKPREEG